MNESLKRGLSGAVYVLLLISCISYSQKSLSILFGLLLIIGVYEFCKMCNLNLIISLLIALISYYFFWNKSQDIISKTIFVNLSVFILFKFYYVKISGYSIFLRYIFNHFLANYNLF